MADDRLERLLKGYALPDVPPALDERVLRDAGAVLFRTRLRTAVEEGGRTVLHTLGFGYLTWLFDLATTADAEYRVEFF